MFPSGPYPDLPPTYGPERNANLKVYAVRQLAAEQLTLLLASFVAGRTPNLCRATRNSPCRWPLDAAPEGNLVPVDLGWIYDSG